MMIRVGESNWDHLVNGAARCSAETGVEAAKLLGLRSISLWTDAIDQEAEEEYFVADCEN